LVTFVYEVVEVSGWHDTQGFDAGLLPAATAVPLMPQPLIQVPDEQTSPVPHDFPLGSLLQALVELLGMHSRQGLVESTVFAVTMGPLMSQSAEQVPEAQIIPVPHDAPFPSTVQPVVDCDGSHSSQVSTGLIALAATMLPPMSQAAVQAPEAQIRPVPQPKPLGSLLQLLVEAVGAQSRQELAESTMAALTIPPSMKQSAAQVPEAQIMPASQTAPFPSVVQAAVDCDGSHSWQALAGLTTFAVMIFPPMSQSAEQVPEAQTPPAEQENPSGSLLQAVVELAGTQSWQELVGLTVFAVTTLPPMSQSAAHAPEAQITPLPHETPLPSTVQLEVDWAGTQAWQASFGLTVVAGKTPPSMSQTLPQTPEAQSSEVAQPVPSGRLVQSVVELPGWQL
jgi:hypothetical protein